VKVFHHNDLDGECAAAIVGYALPQEEPEYCEMWYGRALPVRAVGDDEPVVIVDFSVPEAEMAELLKRTERVMWIDHHKTAARYDYGRELKGSRDFSGQFAACELTWGVFFRGIAMPLAVRLVGDRDKWAWKYGEETARFCAGMASVSSAPDAEVWIDLLGGVQAAAERITERGAVVLDYRREWSQAYRRSYIWQGRFEGRTVWALNLTHLGSEMFGDYARLSEVVVGYVHDGREFVVSLYTEEDNLDLGELARKYGGGGHRKAAGFRCERLPVVPVARNEEDA